MSQADGAITVQRGHLDHLLGGDDRRVDARILRQGRREIHRAEHVLVVAGIDPVATERDGHAGFAHLDELPHLRRALGKLQRGGRVLAHLRVGLGQKLDLIRIDSGHVIEKDVRTESADPVHVLDRPMPSDAQLRCRFFSRAGLVHERVGTVAVGYVLCSEHEIVGAGSDAFDGRKNLDAAIGCAVERLMLLSVSSTHSFKLIFRK